MRDGYAVTIEVSGGIDSYAKALLAIFNNVRNSYKLISVENYNNNDITVNCTENSLEATKEFLEQFSKIKRVGKIQMYQLAEYDCDCDYDKYDNQIVVPYFG